MKVTKWLLGPLVLAGAGAGGWYFLLGGAKKVEYTTAKLTRGDIEAIVSATGSCNAVVSVQVGSQVSGNILELRADYNTKVTKNQLVAVIDPAPFQAKVDQARANVESARASVLNAQSGIKKAEADIASAVANVVNQKAQVVRNNSSVADAKSKLARRKQLFDEKVASKEDYDTAQATYDQAVANQEVANAQVTAAQSNLDASRAQQDVVKAQLESAQSQVKQQEATLQTAMLDLEHTQIRAPVDGTVIARNMDVGQTVAASFSAPTIFQIAQDLTKMEVDANIDESDISRIQVDQPATFTVDAYPGQTFQGVVKQIRRAPINVQNVITYVVVIGVDNPDLKLFPGMTANVRLLVDRVTNVLRLPTSALRVRLDGVAIQENKGKDFFKETSVETPASDAKQADAKAVDAKTDGSTKDASKDATKAGDGKRKKRGDGKGGFGGGDGSGYGGRFGAQGDASGSAAAGAGGRGGGKGGRAKGTAAPGARQAGTVYILGDDGKAQGLRIRTGIGDGSFVQVVTPNLQEGMTVITGVLGATPQQAPGFQNKGKNNFKGGGFF